MQTCKSCGYTQNRDTARFCANCATPLRPTTSPTCPRCGAVNSSNARFCARCALPLASAVGAGLTGLLTQNSMLQSRYLILRKLGQGGMGAVYQAQDTRLPGKMWAIKELTPALIADPTERQSAIKALRHEFEMLMQLQHPNLPRVSDLFEENGNQYLVMDFIEGQTLEQVVSTTSNLTEATVMPWIAQVCDVLEYLHSRQPSIVFRDLKPSNIMLEPSGTIKLIDFGIARIFQPGKTKDTAAYGTVGYAAPEQFGSGQTDARSDVYSLGVTMHHLLTRYDPAQAPFNLPVVRSLNSQVSEHIEQVIVRATKSVPVERFQSIGEMRRALSPAVVDSRQALLTCDRCHKADHTLRATVFLYVISIILATFKRGWGGVLCRSCRIKYGTLFTMLSLLLGPWGFPWGIIYTLQAFFTNLFGGTQPKENNAPLLAYQGMRFLERGDAVSAYACLNASVRFQPDPNVEAVLNQIKPMVLQQAPGTQLRTPGASSSGWKWAGAGAVLILIACGLFAMYVANSGRGINIGFNPLIAVPTTPPPTATPTPSADAVTASVIDLRAGPGFSYDLITTLTVDQQLRVIGREPKLGDWILVETGSGRRGWVMVNQVKLNIALASIALADAPSTPTPRVFATATLRPITLSPAATATRIVIFTPTWTAIPKPKVCPPNPAYMQINNFLETGLVIEFSGPTTADVYVPSNGSVKLCLGQGMYTYTSRAIGYTTDTKTKLIAQDSTIACSYWDWWPASGLQREGTCSSNRAEYYAP